MELISAMDVKQLWGNYIFDHSFSEALGNSGVGNGGAVSGYGAFQTKSGVGGRDGDSTFICSLGLSDGFNTFISSSGLIDVQLEGPILLRECISDFGAIPFWFYHSWFGLPGFYQMVIDSWNSLVLDDNNELDQVEFLLDDLLLSRNMGVYETLARFSIFDQCYCETSKRRIIVWPFEGDENLSSCNAIINKKRANLSVKSVRLDGECLDWITFEFFRKFWKVVGPDFCIAVEWFFEHGSFAIGCNSSFVALIPKILDPKISAFLPNRQILDGPFILSELLSWCKFKYNQAMVFKVDFAKAYDSIRWSNFWKGYFRHGKPDIRNLFISLFCVDEVGIFTGIEIGSSLTISHLFYADDAVFIGEWSHNNLKGIMNILRCFSLLSGLSINVQKIQLLGIGISDSIISEAAKSLVEWFFEHGSFAIGCNSSFVALISKILDPKISAFLPNRQILDGPFILSELLSWCKFKYNQVMVFKVDFSKAYDSIMWDYLDDVLNSFGFGSKWRSWIRGSLISGKASILVNGSPTSEFQFHGGLKQGDPLAPFLFILITESPHLSFSRAVEAGIFTGIEIGSSHIISHLFYADDTVFIGEWSHNNLKGIMNILRCFSLLSGLSINVKKSQLLDIGISDSIVSEAAKSLGCSIMKTPFKYLGIPVIPIKVNVFVWKALQDPLPTRSNLVRRNILIDSLSCPICDGEPEDSSHLFFRCCLARDVTRLVCRWWDLDFHSFNSYTDWQGWFKQLRLGAKSKEVLEGVFYVSWWSLWNFRNHLLFADSNPRKDAIFDEIVLRSFNWCLARAQKLKLKKIAWVKWPMVLASKKHGGLGVSNFYALNRGLLFKWVWRYISQDNSLWARVISALHGSSSQINFVSLLLVPFAVLFEGGLEAQQLDHLMGLIESTLLSNSEDRWVSDLNGDGVFRVKDVRNLLDETFLLKADTPTRWIKCIPIKVNVFVWKALQDRLPTRSNLVRRNILIDSLSCSICDGEPKDSSHLFFSLLLGERCDKSLWNFRNHLLFADSNPRKDAIFDEIVLRSFNWCLAR
ncbi:RNA-directed DNA polymerase, eukaryota, partial [Tanacetum coccineum]